MENNNVQAEPRPQNGLKLKKVTVRNVTGSARVNDADVRVRQSDTCNSTVSCCAP